MNRLTNLANKHKTDKGTEYMYSHGFTLFYEPFLQKFENPTILEIGTAEGSSAKMFNDYFDGNCTIYTVDINDNSKKVEGYNNIHFIQCDAGGEKGIWELLEILKDVDFDIIIDDGSHVWEHQFLLLMYLHRKVKKGGIYILEDLHTSYDYSFTFGPKTTENSPLFFLNFFDRPDLLGENETNDIKNSIEDVFIFNHRNEKNFWLFANRSITAVLTFRDK